jgi:hypothetical protein
MVGSARRGPHNAFDLIGRFSKLGLLDAGTTCLSINPDWQTKRDLLSLLR